VAVTSISFDSHLVCYPMFFLNILDISNEAVVVKLGMCVCYCRTLIYTILICSEFC